MRLAFALGLVFAVVWGSVRSDEPALYTLHIESQPLDVALREFARKTGMQVLFFSELTDGLRSTPLDGKYTLDRAMTTLLSESGLTYRLINSKTIQISRLPAAPAKIRRRIVLRTLDAASCAERGHPHDARQ
jgi:iron complex outermembrane recepter protein